MFRHMLVPLDGSELSERAANASIELARKLDARITAFIAEPLPPLPDMSTNASAYLHASDDHRRKTESHARAVLSHFAERAGVAGVRCEVEYRDIDRIDDAIVAAAEEFGCDLIVMVTHDRGALGELLFGSHTKGVLARSRIPLLVLH